MTGQYWPYVVIVVGLMMAYGYWRYFQQRKKTRAYLATAQQRGWQYIPHDGEIPNRFTGEPFGKGFSRTAQDVLAGPHRATRWSRSTTSTSPRAAPGKTGRRRPTSTRWSR
jgi:hypothetical protein